MARVPASKPGSSLRWKFLLPLLLAGTGVTLAGAWFTYQNTESQLERQLLSRSELLASALNHAAMVATTHFQVQHVVEEVMKDSPEIERIVVFTENDGKVLAASEASWVGQGIEQLPDHVRDHLTEARQDGAPGHHFDADGKKFLFAAPLGTHVGAHADSSGQAMPAARMEHDGADNAMPSSRGVILVQLNRRATNLAVSSILWREFLALLAAVALTMVLAYFLVSEHVLDPLRRIRATMTRRRSGDMTARAPSLKDDEMGDLARTFNDMLDALDDQRAELGHQPRADRTVLAP